MSHVIGQGTIASNHYRTSEYRLSQYQPQPVAQPVAQSAEQFNSETVEFEAAERRSILRWFRNRGKGKIDEATQESIDKTIKNMETILPDARKAAAAGEFSDEAKKMFDTYDNEEIISRLGNYFNAGGTPDSGEVQWLRTLLKGGDDLDELATNKTMWNRIGSSINGKRFDPGSYAGLDKKSIDAATDAAEETIKNAPMSDFKRRITNGGLVIGGGVALIGSVMGFGGNEALQKWVDQVTGRDCGPKAEAQQLEGDEYSASVEACQQGSLDALYKLGVGALAIAGFIGVIAVTRAIPKKKAPEEEDSEDEE